MNTREQELVNAARRLRDAINDPGPRPSLHAEVMAETFRRWPTLGRSVYDVIAALDHVETEPSAGAGE